MRLPALVRVPGRFCVSVSCVTFDLTMTKKDTMAKLPGLFKREGIYQLRIMIPKDLQEAYEGRTKVIESLGVSSSDEAKTKGVLKRGEWLTQFSQKRLELNPHQVDMVTPELAAVLSQRVAARLLQVDQAMRDDPGLAKQLLAAVQSAAPSKLAIRRPAVPEWLKSPTDPLEGLPEELAEQLRRLNSSMSAHSAMQMATQRVAAVLPMAQAEGRKLGIAFDVKTPGALYALRECLKAYRRAWQDIGKRDAGEVVDSPDLASLAEVEAAPRPGQPRYLRDVFERWKGVKRRSADSVRACERALVLFEERTGNTPVRELTRAQGDDFRSWLQTLGTSSKTAHDRITWVKSLLVYAYRDLELIPRQPWEGIDIEHATEKRRKPWTPEELKAFFGLPLFKSYELPKDFKAGKDAAYWIPLLGLYTGARVGELAQLRVADVEAGKEGAFLRITEEAEGQRVKTAAGHRRVPVHSQLVKLGFLDYFERVKKSGAELLWPHMRFRKGKPGAYFSDWFNRFHKEQTGNPQAPVFHELRHTVRTALHSAGVDRETIGRIIGHETGLSDAEKAYTHVSDADLMKAVERLRFPNVKVHRGTPT
jgi:integrase